MYRQKAALGTKNLRKSWIDSYHLDSRDQVIYWKQSGSHGSRQSNQLQHVLCYFIEEFCNLFADFTFFILYPPLIGHACVIVLWKTDQFICPFNMAPVMRTGCSIYGGALSRVVRATPAMCRCQAGAGGNGRELGSPGLESSENLRHSLRLYGYIAYLLGYSFEPVGTTARLWAICCFYGEQDRELKCPLADVRAWTPVKIKTHHRLYWLDDWNKNIVWGFRVVEGVNLDGFKGYACSLHKPICCKKKGLASPSYMTHGCMTQPVRLDERPLAIKRWKTIKE